MKKKFLAILLSLAMVATMMPLSIFASTTETNDVGDIVPASALQKGDVVKLPVDPATAKTVITKTGAIDADNTVSFNVLDTKTSAGGEGVFLMTGKVLSEGQFSQSALAEGKIYQKSDLYKWCQKLKTVFPEAMQKLLVPITKTDVECTVKTYTGSDLTFESGDLLTADSVFALSAEEAYQKGYFGSEMPKLDSSYFLRSGVKNQAKVAYVTSANGYPITQAPYARFQEEGYAPALNLSADACFKLVGSESNANVYEWVNAHTVKFDSQGGSPVDTQYVEDGEYAKEPTAPKKEGFQFNAWFRSAAGAGTAFNFKTEAITEDLTLFADYTKLAEKCEVTFIHDGAKYATAEVDKGKTVEPPETPEKEGYTFRGWFLSEVGAGSAFDFKNTPINEDTILYSHFTKDVEDHTVTFYVDGNVYKTETVGDGHYATRPVDPEKDGYKFNGWFTTPVAAGSGFDFENTPIYKDTNLYADWIEIQPELRHDVSFLVDGELYCYESVPDGGQVSPPTVDPTKDGYEFTGWFLNKDGKGTAFDFDTPITKDTTLYAGWASKDNPNPNPKPPINHDKTGKTTNTKGSKGIKTGDNNMVILFTGLGAVAIGTALVVGLRRKSSK